MYFIAAAVRLREASQDECFAGSKLSSRKGLHGDGAVGCGRLRASGLASRNELRFPRPSHIQTILVSPRKEPQPTLAYSSVGTSRACNDADATQACGYFTSVGTARRAGPGCLARRSSKII